MNGVCSIVDVEPYNFFALFLFYFPRDGYKGRINAGKGEKYLSLFVFNEEEIWGKRGMKVERNIWKRNCTLSTLGEKFMSINKIHLPSLKPFLNLPSTSPPFALRRPAKPDK